MASKKPLIVNSDGSVQQLQAADTLTVGDYDLPNAISDNGKVVVTTGGAATWDYANHTTLVGVTADQHHNEAHAVSSHSDTTATGTELNTLTDGSDATALHTHDGSDHDIADHNDTTATGTELETLTDGSSGEDLHTHATLELNAASTFYIAPGGSDMTGDGTVNTPWKSVHKGMEAIHNLKHDYDEVATVECAEGRYTLRETELADAGVPVVITGPTPLVFTYSAITVVTNIAGNVWDITLTVNTTTGMATGYFLGTHAASNKLYMHGAWQIMDVIDGTHVKVRIGVGVPTPSTGNTTGDMNLPLVAFETPDEYGFHITGPDIQLTNMTIVSDGGDSAIFIDGAERALFGPDLCISEYTVAGVRAEQAQAFLDEVYISNCTTCFYQEGGSYISMLNTTLSDTVVGYRGTASHLYAVDCHIVGATTRGLGTTRMGSISCFSCLISGCVLGIWATRESLCYNSGNVYSGNTLDLSPAANTEGNSNSYMHDA